MGEEDLEDLEDLNYSKQDRWVNGTKLQMIPTQKQKKLMSQFGLVKESDTEQGNPVFL